MKHTPGPFSFEHNEFIGSLTITAPTDRTEYLCRKVGEASYDEANNGYYVGDLEEAKANMRLFAAAPDLLEALQWYVKSRKSPKNPSAGYLKAQTAIAKAIGEQP